MDIAEKIIVMVGPSLAEMGYRIVQIRLTDGKRRKTLMLMAERLDERIMGFDDCAEISRTVSALLDVEDPISGAYDLEVCSPGVDRPLVTFDDYVRHAGYEIKLETLIPLAGRKRFRGKLRAAQDGHIVIETDETGETALALTNIRHAKLVLTDELMKSYLKQAKKAGLA